MKTINKYKILTAIAPLTFSSLSFALDPECLDAAQGFNAFIQNDFTAQYTDIQGRLAAGGNVDLLGYGVATSLTLAPEDISFVVGGDISFDQGQVHSGSVEIGGSADNLSPSVGLVSGATLTSDGPISVNFDTEFDALNTLSESLSTLDVNTTVDYLSYGMSLHGDCESNLQVFNLDGNAFLAANVFMVECVPSDATVIFNIDGESGGARDMDLSHLYPHAENIIYNFYEATSLQFASIGMQGSILAPKADVDASWGFTNGTVITKSWAGPMELHHVPFEGCLNITPFNHDPIITNLEPPAMVVVGETYTYQPEAFDPDGDVIRHNTYIEPSAPGLDIDRDTGLVTWDPIPGDEGTYHLYVIVQDNNGGFTKLGFDITVKPAP